MIQELGSEKIYNCGKLSVKVVFENGLEYEVKKISKKRIFLKKQIIVPVSDEGNNSVITLTIITENNSFSIPVITNGPNLSIVDAADGLKDFLQAIKSQNEKIDIILSEEKGIEVKETPKKEAQKAKAKKTKAKIISLIRWSSVVFTFFMIFFIGLWQVITHTSLQGHFVQEGYLQQVPPVANKNIDFGNLKKGQVVLKGEKIAHYNNDWTFHPEDAPEIRIKVIKLQIDKLREKKNILSIKEEYVRAKSDYFISEIASKGDKWIVTLGTSSKALIVIVDANEQNIIDDDYQIKIENKKEVYETITKIEPTPVIIGSSPSNEQIMYAFTHPYFDQMKEGKQINVFWNSLMKQKIALPKSGFIRNTGKKIELPLKNAIMVVKEGDSIKKGETIAIISANPKLKAELNEIETKIDELLVQIKAIEKSQPQKIPAKVNGQVYDFNLTEDGAEVHYLFTEKNHKLLPLKVVGKKAGENIPSKGIAWIDIQGKKIIGKYEFRPVSKSIFHGSGEIFRDTDSVFVLSFDKKIEGVTAGTPIEIHIKKRTLWQYMCQRWNFF